MAGLCGGAAEFKRTPKYRIEGAGDDYRRQAAEIVDALIAQGEIKADEREDKIEVQLIALIAYLQRLGDNAVVDVASGGGR